MDNSVLKYNMLGPLEKKEVSNFIDFLFSKMKKKSKQETAAYKKKILTVSAWSEDDIKVFEENKNKLNEWQPGAW